jgi:60 kDa SS-A/Ro ribonucleoprotein
LANILSIAHPKPSDEQKNALFGWLLEREYDPEKLPALLKEFETWKTLSRDDIVPQVPFEMLTAHHLSETQWKVIARNAGWQWTRMNLNTMMRHNVFSDSNMVEFVAKKLMDREIITKIKVFPYQLLAAYLNADSALPPFIRTALGKAVEISTENVPCFGGKVYVFVDVSGSMSSSITGYRKGSTSSMRCVDVAALVASVILRRNPGAEVIPFDTRTYEVKLSPDNPIMENARLLAKNGGGTDCSIPLAYLNNRDEQGDLLIYVSDNESWADSSPYRRKTGVMTQWIHWRERNPHSKLVCIDLTPYTHTQAHERSDILNIGGFSDTESRTLGCGNRVHCFVSRWRYGFSTSRLVEIGCQTANQQERSLQESFGQ